MENDEERTDEPESKRSERSHRHEHTLSDEPTDSDYAIINFFKKYRVEVFAVCLLAVGIFLLVERWEIKWAIYVQLLWWSQRINEVGSRIISVATSVQKSDIVGLILMCVAVYLITWRMRWRAITRYRHLHLDFKTHCPKCGDHLRRVPERVMHRVLEFVFRVRIRPFSCEKCQFHSSRWDRRH